MERIMVTGTGGTKTYLAIARKGNIVLSIKPNAIADADKMGVPGLTYFGARLRSALTYQELAEHDAATGTVPFGKFVAADKWGGIDWEKIDESRASAQVGTFLRGTIAQDADKLLEAFAGGKLSRKFAKYLIEQAGEGVELLTTQVDLAAWLDEVYAPYLKHIVAQSAKFAEVQKTIGESIGVFASQTTLLKKMFKDSGGEEVPDIHKTDGSQYDNDAMLGDSHQPDEGDDVDL